MFHVAFQTTLKFNRNQLETVSAYVICYIEPFENGLTLYQVTMADYPSYVHTYVSI